MKWIWLALFVQQGASFASDPLSTLGAVHAIVGLVAYRSSFEAMGYRPWV